MLGRLTWGFMLLLITSLLFSSGRWSGWLLWPSAWTNNILIVCAALLILDEWRRRDE